jgi:hypothetical protein
LGIVAVPSSVPVGEPARNSIVPPSPPDDAPTVTEPMLFRFTGPKLIQSLLSMSPTRLPARALARSNTVTPDCASKCSASLLLVCDSIRSEPTSAGAAPLPPSVYAAVITV